jgi:glycosyltransferase involved in cell wall biosynthesis
MKILQLVDSLNIGGAERMCVNISKALSNHGHDVILCTTRKGGDLVDQVNFQKFKLISLGKKSVFDLLALYKLFVIIKKHQIEIIHAHSSSLFWACLVKFLYPKVKIIWHDHYGKGESLSDHNRLLYKFTAPFIFGIISVNEILQNWSIRNMKVDKSKIIFLRNFPLLDEIQMIPSSDNKIRIACIANFREQKDHITLLKAFLILIKNMPEADFELVLAGSYNSGDQYYQSVINFINQNNLKSKVKIPGVVTHVEKLLSVINIGVLSSTSEGLPVSLLEFGMAGLPVVATFVGQCQDVLDNGNAGWLVEPKDFDALSEALTAIIIDKEEAKIRSNRLKERVLQKFGAESFLEGYYKLIGV